MRRDCREREREEKEYWCGYIEASGREWCRRDGRDSKDWYFEILLLGIGCWGYICIYSLDLVFNIFASQSQDHHQPNSKLDQEIKKRKKLKFEVLNWCRQLNQSLSIYVEYKSWSFFTFFPFENSSWDPIQPRNKLIHPSESKTLMKFFLTAIWVGLQTELKSSAYRLQVLRGYDQSPSHGHRFISCLKSSRPGFHIDLVFRPRGYIYQRWRGGLWIRYSTNVELYLTQAISHQLQNIDE